MDSDVFVIDAGSYSIRAGRSVDFPSEDEPRVVIDSVVEPREHTANDAAPSVSDTRPVRSCMY